MTSDAILDCLIRCDEARFTDNNKLANLSDKDRRAIYACTDQYMCPEKKRDSYKELSAKASTFTGRLSQRVPSYASGLAPLTQNPIDTLPDRRDETLLACEYDETKKLIEAKEIVNDDESNPKHRYVKDAVELTGKNRREEDRKAQLYYIAKLQAREGGPPTSSSGPNVVTDRSRSPGTGKGHFSCMNIPNSRLPGPYLTLETDGQHTRYEAVAERLPATRSAQSIQARRQITETHRSRHYPRAASGNVEPAPVEDGDILRRWKHQMGTS